MRIIFGLISILCSLLVILWLAKTQFSAPDVVKSPELEALGVDIPKGATPAEIQEQYRDKVNELMQQRDQQLRDE